MQSHLQSRKPGTFIRCRSQRRKQKIRYSTSEGFVLSFSEGFCGRFLNPLLAHLVFEEEEQIDDGEIKIRIKNQVDRKIGIEARSTWHSFGSTRVLPVISQRR